MGCLFENNNTEKVDGSKATMEGERTSNGNVNPQEQRKRTINSSKKANITSSIHTRVCVCMCVW